MGTPKRGRVLYGEIFDSRRVARLGVKGALLWCFMLPAADSQGRIHGDAVALRDRLVPHFPEVIAGDVETALEAMVRERLIRRYKVHRQPFIQILDWWKWNSRLTYKRPSGHPAPQDWRDRVTARYAQGGYVPRIVYGMIVYCPNCSQTVGPVAHGRGWVCPQCDVELLGTRVRRPVVGGMQTRVTGKLREQVLAALASGPQTKVELAASSGRSESSIGSLLPKLRRSGDVVRVTRKRPYTYRLKAPQVNASFGAP